MRARFATLILAASVSLGGCAYGGGLGGLSVGTSYGSPYGYGGQYGSPYGYGSQYASPYGYGSPYGSPYGYGGYGYDPFNRYNPYYRSNYYGSPFGWYDGFYYPGTGDYVYDRQRQRRPLTEQLRKIWMQRAAEAARTSQTSGSTATRTKAMTSPNWSEFNREGEARAARSRGGLANQIGTRARTQTRASERQTTTRTTTRTVRSPSTSNDLGATIRRRINNSND